MANVLQLSDTELEAKLQEILQSWPLYRSFTYEGAANVESLPKRISLHCDNCGKEQLWGNLDSRTDFPDITYDGFLPARRYACKNCGQEVVRYFVYWSRKKDGSATVFKTGQYPPLEERIPKELKLEGEDLDFYQKALRCRNFNYGLAGVAYLRRVIENRMNEMLDLIAQEARTANFAEQDLKKLKQVKAGNHSPTRWTTLPASSHPISDQGTIIRSNDCTILQATLCMLSQTKSASRYLIRAGLYSSIHSRSYRSTQQRRGLSPKN